MRRLSSFLVLLLTLATGGSAVAVPAPVAGGFTESAWRRCLVKSARAKPGRLGFRPNRVAYQAFLSRLRRECGMIPPGWWRRAIRTAWVGRNGSLTSPNTAPNHYYDAVVHWQDADGRGFGSAINLPRHGIIGVSGSTLILFNGSQALCFPCYSGELFQAWEGQLDAVWSRNRIFLANHSSGGDGLAVCCINSQSGRVLWSKQFGEYMGTTGTGRPHHNLLLHARDRKLWVWCAGSMNAGVWRLDARTGATLFSFFIPNWKTSSLSFEAE